MSHFPEPSVGVFVVGCCICAVVVDVRELVEEVTVVVVVVDLIAGVVSQYFPPAVEIYVYPHRLDFMSGNNNIILLHNYSCTSNSSLKIPFFYDIKYIPVFFYFNRKTFCWFIRGHVYIYVYN